MEDKNTHANADLHYPVQLVHATCYLAGSASYLDDVRADLHDCGIIRAIKDHDTPALFDWLVEMLSYQGISDSVAAGYIAQHGSVRWADIADGLSRTPSCPKLGGYWRFYGCRYHKGLGTCGEPGHIDGCPLPRHPLRNGRLNQMAYSLFLFMRDVADNDFVGWIDQQLGTVNSQTPDRLATLREAIIGPLRNVYGVSDKVLAMALSNLLSAAGNRRPLWVEHFRRCRHPGPQFSASHRDPATAARRPPVRRSVLPAGRVRRDSPAACGQHRRAPVQTNFPVDVSAVRAERNLAVLRRERPRHLQRQSD